MKTSHQMYLAATLALSGFVTGPSFASDAEIGKALFADNCQTCHGANGDGNGPAAETFILKPRDFAMAAFKFDTDADWERGTDADLANVIRQGPAAYGGSPQMPSWGDLETSEIKSLIAYIRSLKM